MIRISRWPALSISAAVGLLLPWIAGTSFDVAQIVEGGEPAAQITLSSSVSSQLLLSKPNRGDAQNEYADIVYSVRFSPDGKTVASGWGDGAIRICDVTTRKSRATFVSPRHMDNPDESILVRSVAVSPDGKTLASANTGSTSSGMIRLWDLTSGKIIAAFNGQTNNSVLSGIYCVVYSPDGKRLASGHEDHVIRLWETDSGKIVKELQADVSDSVYSVAFSPDGKSLASGGRGGSITLWNLTSGERISTLKAVGDGNPVCSLVYSPDGETLGAGCWLEGGGMLWDVGQGTNTVKFKPERGDSAVTRNPNEMTYSVAFSPDGQIFAQGCDNGIILLWNVSTQTKLAVRYGHTKLVRSLDFSPDGTALVSGSDDGTVRLWTLKER